MKFYPGQWKKELRHKMISRDAKLREAHEIQIQSILQKIEESVYSGELGSISYIVLNNLTQEDLQYITSIHIKVLPDGSMFIGVI